MNSGKGLEHESLTEKIIGCAITVHKKLGPGFLESIYENAFIIELQKQNLQVEKQREVVIKYDDFEVGRHRLDLIVADTIVVELKAVKNIEDIHFCYCEILFEGVRQRTRFTHKFFQTYFRGQKGYS